MNSFDLASCRSLLFVPLANARIIARAHERGADALILDLEDSVAVEEKATAREALPSVTARLAAAKCQLLVRINEGDAAEEDLAVAIRPEVQAIMLPKTEDPGRIAALAAVMSAIERRHGLAEGRIRLLALIESPAALFRLPEIVGASPRIAGLALGSEDFSLLLGAEPTPACLTMPCQMMALAAAAQSLPAFGLPISLARFDDLDAYRSAANAAHAMGLRGALCIHPRQVPIANSAFSPSPSEVAWAKATINAWETRRAAGEGVAAQDGQMIDKPVEERARRILVRASETHCA